MRCLVKTLALLMISCGALAQGVPTMRDGVISIPNVGTRDLLPSEKGQPWQQHYVPTPAETQAAYGSKANAVNGVLTNPQLNLDGTARPAQSWLTTTRAPDKTVFLGSAGPNAAGLMVAANLGRTLASGKIGLYQHANGNSELSADQRAAMWATWATTGVTATGQGQSVGEVGAFTPVPADYLSYFGGAYPNEVNMNAVTGSGDGSGTYTAQPGEEVPGKVYTGFVTGNVTFTGSIAGTTLTVTYPPAQGLGVSAIVTGPGVAPGTTITGLSPGTAGGNGTYTVSVAQTVPSETMAGSDLAAMELAIADANAAGAKNVAIFFTPNGGGEDLDDPFASAPYWANVRAAALRGGGIALDVPPSYAIARGQAYQAMVAQMIKWGVSQGIRVALVVSPFATTQDAAGNSSGCGRDPAFLENTAVLLTILKRNAAWPTQWGVEAYGAPDTHCGTENDIATDLTPESLNEVALFLASAAETSPPGITPAPNGIPDAGLQSSPALVPAMAVPTLSVRLGDLGTMAFMNADAAQIFGARSNIGSVEAVNFVNTQNLQAAGAVNLAGILFSLPGLPTSEPTEDTRVWLDGNAPKVGPTSTSSPQALVNTVNLQVTGEGRVSGQAFGFSSPLPACVSGLTSGTICTGTAGGSLPLMKMP